MALKLFQIKKIKKKIMEKLVTLCKTGVLKLFFDPEDEFLKSCNPRILICDPILLLVFENKC